MKFSDTLKRGGRSLKQAKMRTLLTAAALAVGGFTLTATLGAANGAKAYGNQLISTNLDPSSLIVSKDKNLFDRGGSTKPQPYDSSLTSLSAGPGGGVLVKELDQNDLSKIAKLPGVASVFEYYSTTAQYLTGPNSQKYTATVEAYDNTIQHQFDAGKGQNLTSGHVVLPDDYLSLLGFKSAQAAIGQTITVSLRQTIGGQQNRQFTIVGVTAKPSTLVDGSDADALLVSNTDAQSVFDYVNQGTVAADRYLTVAVRVTDGTDQTKLNAAKNVIENAGYGAESAKDAQALITQIINVLQIIILVFGFITLIASFFGVVNTQYISVLERTREIGLMKALGMSRAAVSRLFVVEATWIGFIGAVLGSAVAIGVGTALNPWLSRKLNFGSEHLLIFKPPQVIGLIIFLMLVTTIAGLLPARKAAKLDPIEALRTE